MMKSIRRKITVIVLLVVLILSGTLGLITSVLNYTTSQAVLDETMPELATVAAEKVSVQLENYRNIAFEVGCLPDLSSVLKTTEEKRAIVDQRAAAHSFQRGNLIGVDGISILDGNDYSDRDYFQKSMAGETVCSDPLVSKVTGKLTYIVSAPLWKGGVPNSTVVGVVYFVPNEEFLNDVVKAIHVGESGQAYILSNQGLTIASEDTQAVGEENCQELAKTDSSYQDLADLEKKMLGGETGVGTYAYNGQREINAFAPIPGTNGWSIAITVHQKEFLAGVYQSIAVTMVIVAVFMLLGSLVAFRFGNAVARPIVACGKRLEQLSLGDLTTPVPQSAAKDETGQLLRNLDLTVERLRDAVSDVSSHLQEIGDGDLTRPVTMEYGGDFVALKVSMTKILDSFNSAMGQIGESARQVSAGADQVAAGAQELSQGATQQSGAVANLESAIGDISEKIQNSAVSAVEASIESSRVGEEIINSNEKMNQMTAAMEEIHASSNEIGKIIKTIEDIAFQTNILALNAAVEAARAGAAGKGFAVVADEVRNLASKSAQAAKNTTALIEKSIRSVANGTQIVHETVEAMSGVVDGAQAVTEIIDKISGSTEEQALAIGELVQGVELISSVVQTNSATSQESAAASEELSGQAQMLKELVSRFRVERREEIKS